MHDQLSREALPATMFQADTVPQPRTDESILDALQPVDLADRADQVAKFLFRVEATANSSEAATPGHDAFKL